MKYTMSLVLLIIFSSCNNVGKNTPNTNTKDTTILKTDTVTAIQTELDKRASWLLGEWHFVSAPNHAVESWKRESDTSYKGEAFFMTGNDTATKESLRLVQRGNYLYYIPTVSNQNGNKPVTFKMTDSTGQLLFENKTHDFPQQISYKQMSGNYMVARTSGKEKGKPRSEEFRMIRK